LNAPSLFVDLVTECRVLRERRQAVSNQIGQDLGGIWSNAYSAIRDTALPAIGSISDRFSQNWDRYRQNINQGMNQIHQSFSQANNRFVQGWNQFRQQFNGPNPASNNNYAAYNRE
jgi:hypothetical protein